MKLSPVENWRIFVDMVQNLLNAIINAMRWKLSIGCFGFESFRIIQIPKYKIQNDT